MPLQKTNVEFNLIWRPNNDIMLDELKAEQERIIWNISRIILNWFTLKIIFNFAKAKVLEPKKRTYRESNLNKELKIYLICNRLYLLDFNYQKWRNVMSPC